MFQLEQAIIRQDFTPACSLYFFHFTVLVTASIMACSSWSL